MLRAMKSRAMVTVVSILLTGTVHAANEDNATYLALGDSVAFGLNPLLLPPNHPLPQPSAFVGYPEIVALEDAPFGATTEINAACPGETSSSFITLPTQQTPDLGCHSPGPQGQPPFKTWIGLHTNYPGTQLSFAVSELSSNKHIDLVTLGIGSNDVLLLIQRCQNDTGCVMAGLKGVLDTYGANLTQILTAIRKQAGYSGKLVLVGFYSPNASLIPLAVALNSVTLAIGPKFGAFYADGFTAFQIAATPFGGDVCKAGLLIRLDATTCDIHPSPLGRDILAVTVLFTIGDLF
jgi:lysophospholipase L1-like esterase